VLYVSRWETDVDTLALECDMADVGLTLVSDKQQESVVKPMYREGVLDAATWRFAERAYARLLAKQGRAGHLLDRDLSPRAI